MKKPYDTEWRPKRIQDRKIVPDNGILESTSSFRATAAGGFSTTEEQRSLNADTARLLKRTRNALITSAVFLVIATALFIYALIKLS